VVLSATWPAFVRLATLARSIRWPQAFWWSCSVAPRGWSNFILAVANATPRISFGFATDSYDSDGEAKGADTAPTLDAATLERFAANASAASRKCRRFSPRKK